MTRRNLPHALVNLNCGCWRVCRRAGNKGFTLVETVVYLGLFGILMVAISGLFVSILDIQLESAAGSTVEQDGRYIVSRLLYDARRAAAVVVPAGEGQLANQLQLNIGGVGYTYSLVGGRLQLVNNLGANLLNSFDTAVSGLEVTRVGRGAKIKFTVSSLNIPSSGRAEAKTFETAVGLR